jgi:hypothetical protein
MKPIFLGENIDCSQPEATEDPYIQALCEELRAPKTRSSSQGLFFTIGQALGYLAGQGAQVEISPQTAHILASNPDQAANAIAATLATRCKYHRGYKCVL